MAWLELRIDATQEAIDWVNSSLAATSYTGDVSITEFAESDLFSQEQTDWAYTVRLYLPDDQQAGRQIGAIENQLSSLYRTGMISELQITEIEWKPVLQKENNSPIHRVGKRFVILTAMNQNEIDATDITIKLENSFAFGSGLHPATILSLQLLEQYIQPSMHALDLGSGTGILSVAMAKLGAQVLAIDNDPIAVQATEKTIILNDVAPQITVMQGSLGSGSQMGHWMGLQPLDPVPNIAATSRFDLIVANVLGRIHIALAKEYQQALRRASGNPGLLITSGFNTDYTDEVNAAFLAAGLQPLDRRSSDKWVALVHQLRG